MSKKVTLAKRCGNPNCNDPRCDFVIVEKKESIWKTYKKYSFFSYFPKIVKIGIFIHLLPLLFYSICAIELFIRRCFSF